MILVITSSFDKTIDYLIKKMLITTMLSTLINFPSIRSLIPNMDLK